MSSKSTRCSACKYLRRRCSEDCVLAPHFPSADPERFAHVHKIFGAGNVSRMLQKLGHNQRAEAANCISHEAYLRVQYPVYGIVGIITYLQQEIHRKQQELARIEAEIAIYTARNLRSTH